MRITNSFVSMLRRNYLSSIKNIKRFFSIIKREYLLTFRNFYDILTILVFFILGILIFIFSIGPDHKIYSQIGIGIIWTLLLLSTSLSIKKFYQDDFNDGNIFLLHMSGLSFEFIVWLLMPCTIFFRSPLAGAVRRT